MKTSTEVCNTSQNTYDNGKEVEASLLEHDPVSSSSSSTTTTSSTSTPPPPTMTTTTVSSTCYNETTKLGSRPPMIVTSESSEMEDEGSQPEKEHTPRGALNETKIESEDTGCTPAVLDGYSEDVTILVSKVSRRVIRREDWKTYLHGNGINGTILEITDVRLHGANMAFIQCSSPEEAKQAIVTLNNKKFGLTNQRNWTAKKYKKKGKRNFLPNNFNAVSVTEVKKIHIQNIPETMTREDLTNVLTSYFTNVDPYLLKNFIRVTVFKDDRYCGRKAEYNNRGFCYLLFKTHSAALEFRNGLHNPKNMMRVLMSLLQPFETSGFKLRPLIVQFAEPEPVIPDKLLPTVANLYLSQVPLFHNRTETLKDLFSELLTDKNHRVLKVACPGDSEFAFINFNSHEAADSIIKLLTNDDTECGLDIKGTYVEVKWATPANPITHLAKVLRANLIKNGIITINTDIDIDEEELDDAGARVAGSGARVGSGSRVDGCARVAGSGDGSRSNSSFDESLTVEDVGRMLKTNLKFLTVSYSDRNGDTKFSKIEVIFTRFGLCFNIDIPSNMMRTDDKVVLEYAKCMTVQCIKGLACLHIDKASLRSMSLWSGWFETVDDDPLIHFPETLSFTSSSSSSSGGGSSSSSSSHHRRRSTRHSNHKSFAYKRNNLGDIGTTTNHNVTKDTSNSNNMHGSSSSNEYTSVADEVPSDVGYYYPPPPPSCYNPQTNSVTVHHYGGAGMHNMTPVMHNYPYGYNNKYPSYVSGGYYPLTAAGHQAQSPYYNHMNAGAGGVGYPSYNHLYTSSNSSSGVGYYGLPPGYLYNPMMQQQIPAPNPHGYGVPPSSIPVANPTTATTNYYK